MNQRPTITKDRRVSRQQKGGDPLMIRRRFANFVLDAVESFLNLRVIQLKDDGTGVDADIKTTELGTVITLPPISAAGSSSGQTVYVKACLDDGTECYVPLEIHGTIYRLPADTPGTTPTINAGKVPDGSPELI